MYFKYRNNVNPMVLESPRYFVYIFSGMAIFNPITITLYSRGITPLMLNNMKYHCSNSMREESIPDEFSLIIWALRFWPMIFNGFIDFTNDIPRLDSTDMHVQLFNLNWITIFFSQCLVFMSIYSRTFLAFHAFHRIY